VGCSGSTTSPTGRCAGDATHSREQAIGLYGALMQHTAGNLCGRCTMRSFTHQIGPFAGQISDCHDRASVALKPADRTFGLALAGMHARSRPPSGPNTSRSSLPLEPWPLVPMSTLPEGGMPCLKRLHAALSISTAP
jgi:hypothetical protein